MNKISKMFKLLSRKPYLRSIAILSSGSIMAQAINFVGSIIVARQYTDVTIGYFTYIISIVAMFSTVINGRYDVSIVSADTEEESFALIKLSFYISVILSAVVTIGTVFLTIIRKSNNFGMFGEIMFVYPLLLVAGLINILNAYNNRHEEYKLISNSYFVRTTFQNIIFGIAGIISANTLGLLLGQLTGQFFGIKKQSKKLLAEFKKVCVVTKEEMRQVTKKYKAQLTYSVPATFVNSISYSVISLFIGAFFGMALLGNYSYSVRVLGLPLAIFSSNISKVHFKEANEEIKQTGSFIKSTLKMILFSSLLAVGMVVILSVFAPTLFELIYGPTWRMAGVYVRILAPMFGVRMIVGAVGFSFILASKQKIELLFQVLLLTAFGVLILLAYMFQFNIIIFLVMLSAMYSVIYVAELWAMLYYARKE